MTTYKILEVEKNIVKIEVTFDDGTKYLKRMMAPTDDVDSLNEAINKWLNDYEPVRPVGGEKADQVAKEIRDIVGLKQNMVVFVKEVEEKPEELEIKSRPIVDEPIKG